jgi:hypothetical protein
MIIQVEEITTKSDLSVWLVWYVSDSRHDRRLGLHECLCYFLDIFARSSYPFYVSLIWSEYSGYLLLIKNN